MILYRRLYKKNALQPRIKNSIGGSIVYSHIDV